MRLLLHLLIAFGLVGQAAAEEISVAARMPGSWGFASSQRSARVAGHYYAYGSTENGSSTGQPTREEKPRLLMPDAEKCIPWRVEIYGFDHQPEVVRYASHFRAPRLYRSARCVSFSQGLAIREWRPRTEFPRSVPALPVVPELREPGVRDADVDPNAADVPTEVIESGLLARKFPEAGKSHERIYSRIYTCLGVEFFGFKPSVNWKGEEIPLVVGGGSDQFRKKMDALVDMDFWDAPFEQALAELAKHGGVETALAPAAAAMPLKDVRVSLRGRSMSLRCAFEWLARCANLTSTARSGKIMLFPAAEDDRIFFKSVCADSPGTVEDVEKFEKQNAGLSRSMSQARLFWPPVLRDPLREYFQKRRAVQ